MCKSTPSTPQFISIWLITYASDYCFLFLSFSLNQLTPLHVAARHGRVATVKYLVDEKGVDINIKDNDGVRLHW